MIGHLCSFVAFLMGQVFIMILVSVRSCLRCGETSTGLIPLSRRACAAFAE